MTFTLAVSLSTASHSPPARPEFGRGHFLKTPEIAMPFDSTSTSREIAEYAIQTPGQRHQAELAAARGRFDADFAAMNQRRPEVSISGRHIFVWILAVATFTGLIWTDPMGVVIERAAQSIAETHR